MKKLILALAMLFIMPVSNLLAQDDDAPEIYFGVDTPEDNTPDSIKFIETPRYNILTTRFKKDSSRSAIVVESSETGDSWKPRIGLAGNARGVTYHDSIPLTTMYYRMRFEHHNGDVFFSPTWAFTRKKYDFIHPGQMNRSTNGIFRVQYKDIGKNYSLFDKDRRYLTGGMIKSPELDFSQRLPGQYYLVIENSKYGLVIKL